MYSIGEFSKLSGFTIKTLRFYHEKQILEPSAVDPLTGYRYYDNANIERARIIRQLRKMEFSLSDIRDILDKYDDQAEMLDYLEGHKKTIQAKIIQYQNVKKTIDNLIKNEKEAIMTMKDSGFEVEEKQVDPILVAGVRMKGKYSDCSVGFQKLGRAFGRYIKGKPLCLYYDAEYREEDADFEPCMPIKQHVEKEGFSVRQLTGGKCVCLLHKGPYDQLGRSYARILEYVKQKGLKMNCPTREVYIKGPGIILKGNPKKYLTEIQMFISD